MTSRGFARLARSSSSFTRTRGRPDCALTDELGRGRRRPVLPLRELLVARSLLGAEDLADLRVRALTERIELGLARLERVLPLGLGVVKDLFDLGGLRVVEI